MITPWVNEFLKAFERWSPGFVISCLIIEIIGLILADTPYWRLNPVLVVTGFMGLSIGLAFYAAAIMTLSIFYTEKR